MAKAKKPAVNSKPKPTRAPKAGAKKAPAAAKPAAKKSPKAKKAALGLPEILRDEALKVLNDRQAEEIVAIDLSGKSSVADYLIIASGRSARQIAAIAHYLREAFMKHGIKHIRIEGLPEGNWALVDGGDVIVHLFRPEVRGYYDLESIWDEKNRKKNRAG